jgi:hypothetical protein
LLLAALADTRVSVQEPVLARRPAIVLLSDGVDTASFVGYEDVLELAKESEIALTPPVYCCLT